jgi:hypothetical protein
MPVVYDSGNSDWLSLLCDFESLLSVLLKFGLDSSPLTSIRGEDQSVQAYKRQY